MTLVLPSFSGLSSLTRLILRDCNLGERHIPSDISCLSTLTNLDLSGNNFISIPAPLTRLSKLLFLRLSNCSMCNLGEGDIPSDISGLSSLTDLDLSGNNIVSIPASLTRLSKLEYLGLSKLFASPSKVCNLQGWACISALNCYGLAENIGASTLLKTHLKAFTNSRNVFDVIIPGSEMPEWFNQQRRESSIEIPLPPNIQNDSRWIGVASCCNFSNDDASNNKIVYCKAAIHCRNSG
ncbi:hypothetical protein J1N35_023938 [Gossypium stocksii]|uniref:C-JID domain-containing protein n=1 Tax=Gossypium stocksii TaxID=47602 RepID=A0A9D3VKX3_9ROSI|nr:hypothetical protein J1N35_023938 [Gossypium stocksii]